MNNNKVNKKLVISLIFSLILVIIGGTLAYLIRDLEGNTSISFGIETNFSCSADGGGDIALTILEPTYDCMDDNTIKRTLKVNSKREKDDIAIGMDLWLTVNSIDSALSASENLRYVVTNTDKSCTEGIISSGTFNGAKKSDNIKIFDKTYVGSGDINEEYYLYIWLDGKETNIDTQGKNINLSLGGDCASTIEPEKPLLDSRMVPVTIDDDGTVKTVSLDDPNWYDYYGNKWANAVVLPDDIVDFYQANSGEIVPQSDILAYYVWIPRYKYQIWSADGNATSNPQTINILFEKKDASFTNGLAVGAYRTHPAFWWDSDNDSIIDDNEMLAGIWVGKFESSANKESRCYVEPFKANCDGAASEMYTKYSIRILPNVSPIRYQNVYAAFDNALTLSGRDFGTSSVVTDNSNYRDSRMIVTGSANSHMMKAGEWGAVTYLAHSNYGINKEVRINNAYYITGCGASKNDEARSTSCQIKYGNGDNYYPQSTTGNITGVFDMAGGTQEAVMGNVGGYTKDSYFSLLPSERRYIDIFSSDIFNEETGPANLKLCTIETCGGMALHETTGWYNDNSNFAKSGNPWFYYGGYFDSGRSAGIFSYTGAYGSAQATYTWRSVLSVIR